MPVKDGHAWCRMRAALEDMQRAMDAIAKKRATEIVGAIPAPLHQLSDARTKALSAGTGGQDFSTARVV